MTGSETRPHNRRQPKLRGWRDAFVTALLLASAATSAFAQDYSFDARRIALGGAGGTPNLAWKQVERVRRYRSTLIPVGMIKVLSNVRVFYPNREDFDFSKAVEFAFSPLHTVFGRGDDITGRSFFRDIVHAQLQPDLNAYSGFDPPTSFTEEGLLSENWGKTFMLRQDDRSYQGLYVGAGPYMAAKAYGAFDPELVDILNESDNKYLPNASLGTAGGETDQLAVAITGGYRARLPFFAQDGAGASRNGVYLAANFHYLWGLRLDEFNANLQLDTDSNGLLRPDPPTTPFDLEWDTSSHGRGMAVDVGAAFVVNRWDFGVGVGGVANRINWRDITRHHLTLVSLFGGTEFVHVKFPVTERTRRLELPVTYTTNVSYHREQWSVLTEFAHGFQGNQYRAGLEYRLGAVELRGAGRYSNGWNPTAGVGYNLTRNWGVDVAAYGTQTFLEREPHVGMAISLRYDKR